ncbi:translocation/assembly module TamB domain-containing protein [Halomicronema sp. CCY15110]|uniref:translocation/assembly module TamB domain-containing protein n=1 Tax=Halomicronema sp. CCY15110 TaxID=2767773 RepID=UPI0019525397|nr:translocation/assembly module TamB domain-containing protein [Halomicronema sp. CCY15110]
MSNGSSPEPQSTPQQQRRRLWTTTGLAIGAIATLSLGGVAIAVWQFAHETLSPWASEYLTEALDRPVTLGEVERISITGVQFGPSVMPPTATDPDELYVETIAVRFNPISLLWRQVNPQITLTGVQVYIEQDEQGNWVEVEINLDDDEDDDGGEPFIRVNPTVAFADSEVRLLPYLGPEEPPQVLTLNEINGTVSVQTVVVDDPRAGDKPHLDAQEITLDFSSRPENAGDLDLSGVIRQLDYGENASPNLLDSLEANLAVQAQAIDLAALSPLVFARAGEGLPLVMTAGRLNGNVEAELIPFAAPRLTGTASLEDGELSINGLATPFSEINTQARFQGNRVVLEDTTATFGDLRAQASGTIDPRNGYNLTGAIAPVTLESIADTFNFEYPVAMAGTLQAPSVKLTGPLAKPTVTGLVETVDGGRIDQVEFARVASEVTYSSGGFQFADLVANPRAGGELTGNGELRFGRPVAIAFDVLGTDLPADAIARLYGLPDDVAIGTLALEADIAGPVNDLNGVVTWDAPNGTYPTRGTAEIERNVLTLRRAEIAGGTVTGVGRLTPGQWTADVQAQGLQLGFFNAALRGVTAGGEVRLGGSTRNFSLAGLRGDGDLAATLAGGTLNSTFSLANGTWQADGRGDNLQLQQLSPDLRGTGSATFQLAGSLANLSPTAIQGRANVRLSDGLATARVLNPALGRSPAPLDASLAWDGRLLRIDSLETGGLFASGTVTPQLSGAGAPSIAAIDLNLAANNYNLATLPINFPPALALAGIANLQGRLTGSPNNLNFAGDLALANLALNDLVFDPRLSGPVTYANQAGLAVELLGNNDQITATYVPQTRQLNAEIRAGEAIATATTEGDLLQAQLYNFPISVLNIPAEPAAYGSLRGRVDFANASINLRTGDAIGQFDVEYLGFGYLNVDRLYGGFRYADGVAQLDNGQIVMADRNERGQAIATRTYNVSGRYSLGQTPQLVGTFSAEAGELRDLLKMLQIQELADFRRGLAPNEGFIPASTLEAAKILATNPVGSPNDTLLNQLRRLSEIIEIQILDEIAAQEAPIPPLSELEGSFAGRVNVTATLPADLRATFDLAGENWTWGPDISADQMVAQGSYQNGLVTFAPLQFNSNEEGGLASAALTGSFSLDPQDQTAREMLLEITNVPISNLEDFANLPFDLDGRLNSTATLGGRLGNPQLTGQLEVIDGTLNGTAISNTTATFSYLNARAGLDAQLSLIGADDPLTLTAAVPYRLGFVDIEPADQSYLLRANVKNEGLALLNLFTQQVAWEDGQGEVILDIAGDLQTNNSLPETFQGLITLDDATISASALPVPMTNVTGRVRLVPSIQAIEVEQLTGQFSEGQLSARGLFPLLLPLDTLADFADDAAAPEEDEDASPPTAIAPDEPTTAEAASPQYQPLTLNLDNIALDLQGLYEGQVNGEMQLVGSLLLGPQLTGAIDLSGGTITIPEGRGTTPPATVERNGGDSIFPPFAFADLRILLRRDINIVQGNYLNVNAQGGMRLDGTLSTLRPTGTIQLPSGRIGLFAVELRLAGDDDRADFRGSFDPLLDVTLQTSLPEASSSGVQVTTSPFPRNEVPDNTTLEAIGLTQQGNRLVRINARYTGPASELANLTTDSRNLTLRSSPPRSEGEIVALLSGNVIGAIDALGSDNALTGIGTFVGSALLNTVRDFLGDTVPISEVRLFQVSDGTGGVNEGSDIGAEVGFEISPTISVSVLKVLTNDTPFQFNTRYRLSDEFVLRGTTSYEDFRDRTGVLLEYETRF